MLHFQVDTFHDYRKKYQNNFIMLTALLFVMLLNITFGIHILHLLVKELDHTVC